jgi:hypothetical protein
LEDNPTGAKFFYAFRAFACGNAVLTGVLYHGKGQLCQALKPIFFQKTGQKGPEITQQPCHQRLTQRFLAQNKPPIPCKTTDSPSAASDFPGQTRCSPLISGHEDRPLPENVNPP